MEEQEQQKEVEETMNQLKVGEIQLCSTNLDVIQLSNIIIQLLSAPEVKEYLSILPSKKRSHSYLE